MTKREIIELYLADLNNLVPDSDAKRSRIIDLEDELQALRIHDVVRQSEKLLAYTEWLEKEGLLNATISKLIVRKYQSK